MTPAQLYALGTGDHTLHVKLTRLYDPEPVVVYDGPATVQLETMDRVAKKKRVKGYPDQDFWFSIKNIEWAESSRSSYEPGFDAYIDEDYQCELSMLSTVSPIGDDPRLSAARRRATNPKYAALAELAEQGCSSSSSRNSKN
jgi:hypothetical protein